VSPFFVENYVKLNWQQSQTFCRSFNNKKEGIVARY
jgi:hypothetical protein